ncbi:MAG: PEP-CTERM sorting domain-containing protein [Phycisphaerae bacterium]|nr:PEP-CTERM sorting domain-containing protein [Phycisphaerae bacterium]
MGQHKINWVVAGMVLLLGACAPVQGVTLFSSDYLMQTYAVFKGGTSPTDMTFAPGGDLYVTYQEQIEYGRDGVIYKVSPDRTASLFADGLVDPKTITWGGGTAYGDYLYVADKFEKTNWTKGEVTRISLDGTKSPFAGQGFNQPTPVAIDRYGNFGGSMYVGTGVSDSIYRVTSDGSTELFHYFGAYAIAGTPWDIAFAPQNAYGGLMYVATEFPDDRAISGILAFQPDGTFSAFAPELILAHSLEFDTTGLMFGGALYAYGGAGYGRRIWRVAEDGSTEALAYVLNGVFTFGPDGAMYVAEVLNDTTVISRVFVPEPASLILFALGGLVLRRRR